MHACMCVFLFDSYRVRIYIYTITRYIIIRARVCVYIYIVYIDRYSCARVRVINHIYTRVCTYTRVEQEKEEKA